MALETTEIAIEIANKDGVRTISLPEDIDIKGDHVLLKKVGDELHLIPYYSAWESFFKSDIRVTDDFMETRDQGEEQERESFD